MSPLFWVTYGLLWLILAVVVVLVILLYRQFGLMLMPGSRRVSYGGLNVGARAPAVRVQFDPGQDMAYDWSSRSSSDAVMATFALFALPACPLCHELAKDHEGLAGLADRHPSVQFLWLEWEDAPKNEIYLPPSWILAKSPQAAAHDAMEIPASPFGYVITTNGQITAKGLVNRASDIDAMIADAREGVTVTEPVAS